MSKRQSSNPKKKNKPLNMTNTSRIMQELHRAHPDLNIAGVKAAFKDNSDKAYTDAYDTVLGNRLRKRDLDTLVGRKFHASIIEQLGDKGLKLTNFDKKVLDVMLLEDDFVDNLKHVVTNVGSTVKPLIRPVVQEFLPHFLPLVDALMGSSSKDHEEIRV